MRFTVTARSTEGEVMFEHASLLNALYVGMGLSASGMAEVRIADGNGRARTPAELYQSMFGREDGGSSSRPTGSVPDLPLAA